MNRHSPTQLHLACAAWSFGVFGALLLCPLGAVAQTSEERPADAQKSDEIEPEDATKEPAEPATDKEKFTEALDDFEQTIIDQERHGKYGLPQVESYAKELENEFFANQTALKAHLDPSSPDASDNRQELTARQQHISMLLWQIERVGSQLSRPKNSGNSMALQINKLLSEYRDVMKDATLMRRFHELSRRASDLSRIGMTSQLTNNFYFMHPKRPSDRSHADPEIAPDSPAGDLGKRFGNGPIQSVKTPIGNLIRLIWKDGFLAWDEKHWETPFAGHSLKSIDQEVHAELVRREVEYPEEDRLAAFRKKRLFDTPPIMLLFQDLQHVAGQGKSARRSYPTSGSTSKSRFSVGGIEASLSIATQMLEFTVREESGPDRMLQIRRRGNQDNKELRISLIGERISLLEQASDGSVRWVDIGEEVIAVRATSFAELYAMQPDKIEALLFAQLGHCGIQTPMTRYDPELLPRILERIRGVDEPTKTRFNELVAQIDSGSFSGRQKAYRELESSVSKFSLLLAKTSDEDGRSPEASARLAQLRKKYGDQFHEIDALITKANWMNNPHYLLGLAQTVDDRQAATVTAQLESVTGESFGPNLGRWSEWLESQSSR